MGRPVLMSVLITLGFVAYGCNAPEPVKEAGESYTVQAATVDSANNSITVMIRVFGPANQSHVKAVAEDVIAKHRGQYKAITIKSYVAGSSLSGLPYATSTFENDKIEHQFNPQAATQKIPSH